MDLIKKYLPKTYYADRNSEERIKLFAEHWRRLVKVNQELEQKIDSFLLEAKVKPAKGGQITRPNIKDFFPDKTLQEMMLIYKNNESLFNYIKKLDAYIDELESRLSVY